MMRVVGLRMLVVAMAIVACPAVASSDADNLVTVVGRTRHVVVDDDHHPTETFVLEPLPKYAPLHCTTVGISRDDTYALADSAVTASCGSEVNGQVALGLKIDFTQLGNVGTYEVRVRVTGAAAVPHQDLVLELVHPAAHLRAFSPRTFTDDGPNRLELLEDSGASRIAPLHIVELDSSVLKPLADLVVGRDGKATLTLEPDDSAPLGHTKGVLHLKAPQLAAIDVPFDLEHRASAYWLLLIVPVAGLIGWAVRIRLRGLVEKARLKREVLPQLAALKAAKDDDPLDLLVLSAEIEVLDKAFGASVDKLRTASQNADTALREALAKHDRWREDHIAEAARRAELLRRPWELPHGHDTTTLTDAMEAARVALYAKRLLDARHRFEEFGRELDKLLLALRAWATTALASLQSVAGLASDVAAQTRARLEKVRDLPLKKPPLERTLDSIHCAVSAVRDATAFVLRCFQEEVTAVNRIISALRDDLADVTKHPDQAASKALADKLTDCTAVEPSDLPAAAQAASALRAQLTDRIAALAPPASVMRDVEAKLAQDAFAEALVTAARQSPRMKISSAASVRAPAPPAEPTQPPSGSVGASAAAITISVAPRPAGVETKRAWLAEIALKLATWAIGTGVFFVLYRDKFVGTLDEIASIVGVAFMSDFTLESLTGLISKGRPALAEKPAATEPG
jgi:hypothetical protein